MFRRGFKAWCENTARETRKLFGIAPHEPIDPIQVANHLGIEVKYPSDIPGIDPSCLKQLVERDPDSWSALTITIASTRLIILNPTRSAARETSDLAHEISHILLGHKPSQTGISPSGLLLTAYDRVQEDEANWLAGCLILPREACVHIRKKRMDESAVKREYKASGEMLKFRMNASGVERQAQFWKNRANRKS